MAPGIQKAQLDYDYMCSPENLEEISVNVQRRKGVGDIQNILRLAERLKNVPKNCESEIEETELELLKAALDIPNKTHPKVASYGAEPQIIDTVGSKHQFLFEPKEFEKLAGKFDSFRIKYLGNYTGRRSYYLKNDICRLERALITYFTDKLLEKNFTLISVPDLLHPSLVQSCGMQTEGKRSQVYELDAQRHGVQACLSGTAEIALASYFKGKTFNLSQLPKRVAAVSRCYRAEVSNLHQERGLFRVHEFTKVEMFGLTEGSEDAAESENLLDEFLKIQKELFESLNIHFIVLDMPPHELGAPAYRKYDIEAWMPGRKSYGEISSASNCTDFQSRRLLIKYKDKNGEEKFVHSVNGTACAVPRMLIAIAETNQNRDGSVRVPEVLQGYLHGLGLLKAVKSVELKLIR